MPYVRIEVTPQSVTAEQKRRLIAGATALLVEVLDKDPATTFVLIDEIDPDNWGVGGVPVSDQLQNRQARHDREQGGA